MIDPHDYQEPSCPLSGGEAFYYPEHFADSPREMIPVENIIVRLDEALNREDYEEADRLLRYWLKDAVEMNDRRGELSVRNEMLGLSRRRNDRKQGLEAVRESLRLITELGLHGDLHAATIKLNAATTLKCFGHPEEALPLYEQVFAVYSRELDPADPLFAGLLNNMALTLTDLGRFGEAEKDLLRAADIMKRRPEGRTDAAISFCNLAELYEKQAAAAGDEAETGEQKIGGALDTAWTLLNAPDLTRNGYYAFVCRKCAEGFGYYGYFARKKELNRRADEIYARNRKTATEQTEQR